MNAMDVLAGLEEARLLWGRSWSVLRIPSEGGAHYITLLCDQLGRRHRVALISFRRQYPDRLFPGRTDPDPSQHPLPSGWCIAILKNWATYEHCLTWKEPPLKAGALL
jgi:hypothetical protein